MVLCRVKSLEFDFFFLIKKNDSFSLSSFLHLTLCPSMYIIYKKTLCPINVHYFLKNIMSNLNFDLKSTSPSRDRESTDTISLDYHGGLTFKARLMSGGFYG